MKKLAMLAMLLLVLALCLPSYGSPSGDILVYKVSIASKAIVIDEDVAYIGGETTKGYLVVDVDFTNAEEPGILDSALVLYGKDLDGFKRQVNMGDVINTYDQDPMEKNRNWAVGVWASREIGEMVVIGKATWRDIGFGKLEKRIVATSLTGHGIWRYDPIKGIPLMSSGTVKADLQSNWTKAYNEDGGTDFDDVVADIQNVKLADYER